MLHFAVPTANEVESNKLPVPNRFLLTKSQAFDFFNVTKKGILRIITIFDNSYQRIVESPILFETLQCCLEAGLRKV
jgi:hypothetical protein